MNSAILGEKITNAEKEIEMENWIDLSAIRGPLEIGMKELAEQIVACPIKRHATKEELIGLVVLFRSRGYRAAFETWATYLPEYYT